MKEAPHYKLPSGQSRCEGGKEGLYLVLDQLRVQNTLETQQIFLKFALIFSRTFTLPIFLELCPIALSF